MKVIIGYLKTPVGIIELNPTNNINLIGDKTLLKKIMGMRKGQSIKEFLLDLPRALRHSLWASIQEA